MPKSTVSAPKVAEEKVKVKKKVEFPKLTDAVKEVGAILAEYPDAMTIERIKKDDKYFYVWVDKKSKARKEIAKILHNLWQNSLDKFNYMELSRRLRVKVVDVQGILDADFIEDHNLESYV